MKTWLRDNGLTLTLMGLFAFSLTGQVFSGWSAENQTRAMHHEGPLVLTAYLASGEFLSALFENWESEFLQMWAYVMLTAYMFQRGSPESKDPDKSSRQDRDPMLDQDKPDAPWPVRAGGLIRVVYSHSLGLALLALFFASFILHWINSARAAGAEALAHGQAPPSLIGYLADARFWFESFQNWQSEFLSTAVIVVLGVMLRERGSPESKAVGDPVGKTGND
jgi:hypothetical protein